MTVPKFGKKFGAVSLLHDHACHTGKTYVNSHYFVSLTLSVLILNQREGKTPLIRYLAFPVGYHTLIFLGTLVSKDQTAKIQRT